MENKSVWDNTIDRIQVAMLWFIVGVIVVCILSLVLFDVLAGAGVMTYLTGGKVAESFFISLATSGLLISLMFISYTLANKKNTIKIGWIVGLVSFGVYLIDVYFDSLTADYLRFGQIIELVSIPNPNIQILFRALLGGISTVGETLALTIILGMPVLKGIINQAIPDSIKYKRPSDNNPQISHHQLPDEILEALKRGGQVQGGFPQHQQSFVSKKGKQRHERFSN